MKLERTKNAKRNVIYGTAFKIYQIVMPFLIRTVMIHMLGMEYVGLNSLFTSILQVLNLMELGVGSAMVFSMYKPIAKNDSDTICALMGLYRKYYRIIGALILVGGLAVTPVLPILIKSDLPESINLYVLYFLNLAATVISYWLFAYKNCILTAHQRNDVSSKTNMLTASVEYLLEIVVLLVFRNYYLYLIIKLASQAMTNVVTAIAANKLFPQYNPRGAISKEKRADINKRIRDLFTAKVGGVIINSMDSIVVSAFLGLSALAVFNNYYYILTSLIGIVGVFFTSCMAGVGNSIVTETKEKNYSDLLKFTLMVAWFVGICAACLMGLYQPFMELWVGREYLLDIGTVICFCIYFFVYEIASLLILYKDAAGIWHEDRFRPLITAVANLVLNLILVQVWGMFGILLATVLSFTIIGIPWLLKNLFTVLFKRSMAEYAKKLSYYIVVTGAAVAVTYLICTLVGDYGWGVLVLRGIICAIVPNVIFFICYGKLKEFDQAKEMIFRIIHRK